MPDPKNNAKLTGDTHPPESAPQTRRPGNNEAGGPGDIDAEADAGIGSDGAADAGDSGGGDGGGGDGGGGGD